MTIGAWSTLGTTVVRTLHLSPLCVVLPSQPPLGFPPVRHPFWGNFGNLNHTADSHWQDLGCSIVWKGLYDLLAGRDPDALEVVPYLKQKLNRHMLRVN